MDCSDIAARWHVIQSRSREAVRSDDNLRNHGYEPLLPRIRAERICRSKRVVGDEPLLPNYLFAHLRQRLDDWWPGRFNRGILRLVGFGDGPAPVADEVVDVIRARSGEARPTLESEQRVSVTEGLFRGLDVVSHLFDGNERVVLFLELLQLQVRVTVPLAGVRSA